MTVLRRYAFLTAALFIACGGTPAVEDQIQAYRVQGDALGTTWTVKWVGLSDDEHDVEASVSAELARLDRLMSTWRSDSELSRLNESSGVHRVSAETGQVISDALVLAKETGGAFDPTVGPLMKFWGVQGTPRTAKPSAEALASVQSRVGYEKVVLDQNPLGRTVDLRGTQLDLSAIAKGTGVDWVAAVLRKRGLKNFMVELGGEMVLEGDGVTNAGWRIAVDDPTKQWPDRGIGLTLQMTSGAVATSGNYRNQYVVDGLTVVHTMDPRTGYPRNSDILSASVVAKECQTADGAATALMVMSYEEGKQWIHSRPDLEAVWFVSGPEGIRVRSTKGMEPWIQFVDKRFLGEE